jgi:hypothetical protein
MEMSLYVPFVFPVCIDDTSESRAMVPDAFSQLQWARLPGGQTTPEFEQRIIRHVRVNAGSARGSKQN